MNCNGYTIFYSIFYTLDAEPGVVKEAWCPQNISIKEVARVADRRLIRKLGKKVGKIIDIRRWQ